MPLRSPDTFDSAVVVPLRSFRVGKARLASRLEPAERAALAREMAERVIDAAQGIPTVVVSSDPDVISWTELRGVECLADPGTLDAAACAGRSWARERAITRVAVVHADLPLVTSLDRVVSPGADPVVLAVPCHRGDGTPVLSIPSAVNFRFSYGPGSFGRHCAEAERLGLPLRVVRDPSLSFDIDLPEDLDQLARRTRLPATSPGA
ncbi:MAG: 2-phospho-L-lactate guanylyltransferase [Acidimicrobiia bacterium]|nr:2-phospho-L-lactate guanylyltransferase [Acidimicrobiia bacterium]